MVGEVIDEGEGEGQDEWYIDGYIDVYEMNATNIYLSSCRRRRRHMPWF
jgi:hypothetical protein